MTLSPLHRAQPCPPGSESRRSDLEARDADRIWATDRLAGASLHAPSLAAYEAAHVLRRHELSGHVDSVEWWPSEVLASRAWEVRANLSLYDASYVALAELTENPLCTLDRRLSGAPGLRCQVLVPPLG